MGKSSKKVAVAVADNKSAKKAKRGAEEAIEKAVSAKKRKLQNDEAVAAKKKVEANAVKKKKKKDETSSSDDSSSESDEEPPKVAAPTKKQPPSLMKNGSVKKAASSDSSDSSDSDDSSEEEIVAPKTKSKPVPMEEVSDESSSDSDSEDEKKPAVANAPKAPPPKKVDESSSDSDESDSDDSDSDDSDDEPKFKASAVVAAAKKVEKDSSSYSEESSDESSDDEPPKKTAAEKPVAKATKAAAQKKVDESDSDDESDEGDSDDSDDEPQNKKTKASAVAAAPKKVQEDSSSEETSDESSDEEPPKKTPATSVNKATSSEESSDDTDEESEEEEPKTSKKKDTDVEMVDAATPKQSNGKFEKTPNTPATPGQGSKTLFMGNLSFSVEQANVESFFKDVAEVVDVCFATAPDGSFRGFGHVEFATFEDAQKALEQLNGVELLNRPIRLDLARERGAATPQSRENNYPKAEGNSVFIRGFDKNLEEEEARSALQEHFGACGEITRCSVPRDRDTGGIKGKTEAKGLRNCEEDRDSKQEVFHLLNKCDHLEGIKDKSGSTALPTEASENEDMGGTVNASFSDDGDESGDASEDPDDNFQLADDIGRRTGGTSETKSSYTHHVTHVLSEQETELLSSRKWRYQWEIPAFDSSSCKWKGTGDCSVKDAEPVTCYGLKQKLYKHWLDIYKASGGNDFQSSKQRSFFSLCSTYRDILHHNKKPFYLKGMQEDSSMMDAYIMHSLNHVFKSRDVVMKNEARLAKNQETGKDEVLINNIYLDRGFCRPKVLILLPLASIALRVVKRILQLTPSGNKVNVQCMDRFTKEFGVANNENADDDVTLANGAESENMKPQKSTKPSDFEALFGANNNDHFMVGIKFTRKSIKLYSDFYTSDLIVASPLGLITKIGDAEVEKDKDVDYLSSIEILVIDHADVITMQNWSHVTTVLKHLNQLPSKNHGDDIMRVRQWYLDGHAQFYRQSIILSSYLTPEINASFNQQCVNYEGKLKLSCEHKGILPKVVLQARQIYERFPVESLVDVDDARLEYFIKKVFPKMKDSIQGGVMIFINSYFEFVRVRNFLKSQDSSFCLLGEYTKQSDISRARIWFYGGTRKIMLYTERAHFYHRYKIKGTKNLIMYSLPERKEFYPELVNMLQESHDMSCTVLFSRFDQFRLERIVGNSAAKRLMTSEKDLFVFC